MQHLIGQSWHSLQADELRDRFLFYAMVVSLGMGQWLFYGQATSLSYTKKYPKRIN